jgi:cyanobactin biosynthesis protein (PatB/AcyB/McaB family)
MTLPVLARPVKRSILPKPPYDTLVDPTACVDLEHDISSDAQVIKDHIGRVWVELVMGANFNDPPPLRYPGYRQIMSSATRKRRS